MFDVKVQMRSTSVLFLFISLIAMTTARAETGDQCPGPNDPERQIIVSLKEEISRRLGIDEFLLQDQLKTYTAPWSPAYFLQRLPTALQQGSRRLLIGRRTGNIAIFIENFHRHIEGRKAKVGMLIQAAESTRSEGRLIYGSGAFRLNSGEHVFVRCVNLGNVNDLAMCSEPFTIHPDLDTYVCHLSTPES